MSKFKLMKAFNNVVREFFARDSSKNLFINVLHDLVLMECMVVMTLIFS